MKTTRPLRLPILFAVLACALPMISLAATYTVTNVNNSGAGSLRQAILDANANAAGTPHTIRFTIGSGAKLISPTSALPTITRDVHIDGSTQPGFSGAPLIEISGTSAGTASNGFVVTNAEATFQSLIINRFAGDGIRVDGNQNNPLTSADVYGCWIGTNTFGNLAAGNGGHGINIVASKSGAYNGIGNTGDTNRNVISGNDGDGIHVAADVRASVVIFNNHIGVGANGSSNVANAGDGIEAAPYSYLYDDGYWIDNVWYSNLHYYGTHIGGAPAGSGNVISFNGANGITIPAGSPSDSLYIPILRNFIGTDSNGTIDCGNAGHGISVGTGVGCWIGDTGRGNTISGNGLSGIEFRGRGIELTDNLIGTNPIGGDLGNGLHGVRLIDVRFIDVFNCTIGNNLLRGISIEGVTSKWNLAGNRIGTNAVGSDLGNGSDGIYVAAFDPAYDDSPWDSGGSIGPDNDPLLPGNKVAFNGGDGLRIVAPTVFCNAAGNQFWNNVGQAIDLGNNGVNANDSGDADTGPNGLQNAPVLSFATPTRVMGTLNSRPGIRYHVEIYRADADASGYGEGQVLLGSAYPTTDANGDATFVLAGLSLIPGTKVTAIATAYTQFSTEVGIDLMVMPTTSEFAANATVATSDTGDFGLATNSAGVTEGTPSVTFTVNRTGGSTNAVSVAYTITGITATAGTDYFGTGGTLNFQSGQTSRTITVPITDDLIDEAAETFKVTLSNPMGGPQITGIPEATATITDNDDPPVISINDVSLAEGNAGTTAMGFNVTLSAASSFPVTVHWASANGTATAGIDYAAGSGDVTFNPGDTQKTVSINVSGDVIYELSETFTVSLTTPVNGSIGDGSGSGTILDDDYTGDLQFVAVTNSVVEAAESKSLFVSRTGGSAGTVTVNYAVTGGTAAVGDDYTAFNTSGTLTFLHGETAKQVSLSMLPDELVEGDETIVMTLSSPTGGAVLGSAASTTLTIIDDDFTGSISGRVMVEGGTGLQGVTVTLGGDASESVVTDWMGYYSFTGLDLGGSYTVKPANGEHQFLPGSRSYPDLSNALLDQNFTGTPLVTPELRIAGNGNGTVTLTWSTEATGWTLESSPDMTAGSWTPVLIRPLVGDPWTTLTLPVTQPKAFFRLIHP